MANALPIDREIVKALWLQGFEPREIEERTGVKRATLRTWIAREGWKREGIAERQSNKDAQAINMQDVASRLSTSTLTLCERIIDYMGETRFKSLGECKTASQAISASYATARKALGLDDTNAPQRHLHVHLMKGAAPRIASTGDLEVIDVQCVDEPAAVASAPSTSPAQQP